MLSYIEISKKNLKHNIGLFRDLLKPETKLIGVVKANAYGHGIREIVEASEKLFDCFQVDDLLELAEIRKLTKKPVLVLGYIEDEALEVAVKLNGILSVYDLSRLKRLEAIGAKLKKKVAIHIKIDAFLGRQGLLPDDLHLFIAQLKKCKHLKTEAIYSHFANIEDTSDFSHAQKQIDAFENAKLVFVESGFLDIMTHISASSGILVYEQMQHKSDMVRLGVAMYGMWPSEELRERYQHAGFDLKPVMRWVSKVAQVKVLPSNHSIGYGLTYITKQPTKIAIIPQGYSDGYDRGLSNIGEVLIRGQRCPIRGRVAMNMFAVDVSDLKDVKAEDEVVLLGIQKGEEITAEEIAKKIDTINYEVTTRIWPKLPRILK